MLTILPLQPAASTDPSPADAGLGIPVPSFAPPPPAAAPQPAPAAAAPAQPHPTPNPTPQAAPVHPAPQPAPAAAAPAQPTLAAGGGGDPPPPAGPTPPTAATPQPAAQPQRRTPMVQTRPATGYYKKLWFWVLVLVLVVVVVLAYLLLTFSGGSQQTQIHQAAQPFQQQEAFRAQPQPIDPALSKLPAPRGQVVTGFKAGPTVCLGTLTLDLPKCKPNGRGGNDCPAKCESSP